jgi:hypothetical protein
VPGDGRINPLLPGRSVLVNDLPTFRGFQEDKGLATAPLLLFTVLYEGNVGIISRDGYVAEHVNLQFPILLFEVRDKTKEGSFSAVCAVQVLSLEAPRTKFGELVTLEVCRLQAFNRRLL